MSKKPTDQDPLQKAAEAATFPAPETKPRSAEELLHELQVRQAELEMQNEKLRQAQAELEKSRDRFADLYDLAPFGYLTLSHHGMIGEINLTGAALLGIERDKLPYHFASFVATESKGYWHSHFLNVLKRDSTLACELALQPSYGSRFYAQLDCLHLRKDGSEPVVRIALIDITKRNAIEVALEESNRFFSTLAQVSPVGIFRADAQGNCVYVNERGCEIAGIKQNEALGGGWKQAIHPDDREKVDQAWHASVQARQNFVMEYRFQRPDGITYWVLGQAAVERNAIGETVGYVGTITDITRSKMIAEELRERDELLKESQIVAGLGSYVLDIPTGSWESSFMLDKLFGINESYEHSVEGWAALVHPDDRAMMVSYFKNEVLARGKPFDKEYRIIRHDDKAERWVHGLGRLRFDAQGRPLKMIGTIQDITGRKQAEIKAAALIHRNAVFMQSTPECVHILDGQGKVLEVNDAFCRHLGYAEEEALQLSVPDFDAKFAADEVRTAIAKLWGSHATFESIHRRKDGTLVDVEITVSGVELDGQKRLFALARDIAGRKQLEKQIHDMAFYDPLTKLPNRRLLHDRLQQAVAASTRNRQHGAIMLLDLDRFKILNDTYGHGAGDQLLLKAAHRLKTSVREGDTVARLGGDEFVVILGALDEYANEAAARAQVLADKIRAVLAEPYHLSVQAEEHKAHIIHHSSSSIGVVLFQGHEVSVEELMKRADLAMYEAKHGGRDAVCFFDSAMQMALNARAALEKHMRQALAEQYRLYYQIQVDERGCIVGAEALIRWQHPERGLLMPGEFIPLAEETGLIVPIGKWALQTACAQLKAWENNPQAQELKIAVNISACQFRQADFVEHVRSALEQTGARAELLELEVTESLILSNIEDTIAKMQQLNQFGVNFAMDDFGTGYSSLSNLQRLPLNQIKIDQSFIHDMAADAGSAIIVNAILTMGKNLGVDVVAAGVETEGQRKFLAQQGCHTYQGFLFGKPLSLAEFEQLLKRS